MVDRRRIILSAAGSAAIATSGVATRVFAQSPVAGGKLVRIMNGFPPGGSADVVTRLIADRLRASGYAGSAIVE
ncbi:MAG: tripartite tricarboxylate transporter substrate binding protein, partial [Burkholderiales bacterium]